ncbi:MAG: type II toxin-antitoxin system HicA family toxin [Candidatus Altiarchaeota archaeon]|nr:type II toxin-antitoxin system HicA family toxin [Candidatus Altiarchaeota archaeon]
MYPNKAKGSHIVLAKSDPKGRKGIVVPNHKEIDGGTLAEIIRQTGLTREEFLNLLR